MHSATALITQREIIANGVSRYIMLNPGKYLLNNFIPLVSVSFQLKYAVKIMYVIFHCYWWV